MKTTERTIEGAPKLRREKIIHVSSPLVFRGFLGRRSDNSFVVRRWVDGLPDDVRVVSVHYEIQRDAFAFVLEHESFEVVPDCCVAPSIDTQVREEIIDLSALLENQNQGVAEQRPTEEEKAA